MTFAPERFYLRCKFAQVYASNNLKVGVERLSHITGFIQQWKYVCLNHMRRELPAGGKGDFERFG